MQRENIPQKLYYHLCDCIILNNKLLHELKAIYHLNKDKYIELLGEELLQESYFLSNTGISEDKTIVMSLLLASRDDELINSRIVDLLSKEYKYTHLYVLNSSVIDPQNYINTIKDYLLQKKDVESINLETYINFVIMLYFSKVFKTKIIKRTITEPLIISLDEIYNDINESNITPGERATLNFLKSQISLRVGDITSPATYLEFIKQNKLKSLMRSFSVEDIDWDVLFKHYMPTEQEIDHYILRYIRSETHPSAEECPGEKKKEIMVDMLLVIQYLLSSIYSNMLLKAVKKHNI